MAPAPKYEEVQEKSCLAFDELTYFKYQPHLGLATPLMFLIKSGDSDAISWFLDLLQQKGLLEESLQASTLFGVTPLQIAMEQLQLTPGRRSITTIIIYTNYIFIYILYIYVVYLSLEVYPVTMNSHITSTYTIISVY